MFFIPRNQGNANQNNFEILSHLSKNVKDKHNQQQILVGMWGKGNPQILLMWLQLSLWIPVWRILKKLKINIPYEPGIGLNIILHKLTQPCPLLLSLNPYCWRHHAFTTLSWLWSESFLPWGLDFMVSESTMQVLIFLWSYDAYNLHCDHPGAMSLKVQQWHA